MALSSNFHVNCWPKLPTPEVVFVNVTLCPSIFDPSGWSSGAWLFPVKVLKVNDGVAATYPLK